MNTKKRIGFTLVEILLTVGIGAVVMTAAMGTVNNVVILQRKILVAQDFYRETQLLLEQMGQLVQQNNLDYDRYFMTTKYSTHNPLGGVVCQTIPGAVGDTDDDTYYAEIQTYPEQFFFENVSGDGEIRNYGGEKPVAGVLSVEDPCASAWRDNASHDDLLLIRESSNSTTSFNRYRVTVVNVDGINRVALYDSVAYFDIGRNEIVYGGESLLGYLSPKTLDVTDLVFRPSPNADPALAFALDSKQIQPHVRISLSAELVDPEKYDFTAELKPNITLSTMASSRQYEQIHITVPSEGL